MHQDLINENQIKRIMKRTWKLSLYRVYESVSPGFARFLANVPRALGTLVSVRI